MRTTTLLAGAALGVGILANAGAEASGVPCALDADDYASLAKAAWEPLTREQISALPSQNQIALCKARKLLREVRAAGTTDHAVSTLVNRMTADDVPVGASKYLTESEYAEVRVVIRLIMMQHQKR